MPEPILLSDEERRILAERRSAVIQAKAQWADIRSALDQAEDATDRAVAGYQSALSTMTTLRGVPGWKLADDGSALVEA